jgi:hypothetical protein
MEHGVSSAEYIKKNIFTLLDITKTHGIGSGFYGVTDFDKRPQESMIPIQLKNPLFIRDNEMDSRLTQISLWLIAMVETTINKGKNTKYLNVAISSNDIQEKTRLESEIETQNIKITYLKSSCVIQDIISELNELVGNSYTPEEIRCKLFGAIKGFIKDYSTAKHGDFLLQPIDYLLLSCGYDGIYNESPNGDTFSRGSIAFYNKNPRDQKQAFGNPFLNPNNQLVYTGSVSNCEIVENTITPRTRAKSLSSMTPRTKKNLKRKSPRTFVNEVKRLSSIDKINKWLRAKNAVKATIRLNKIREESEALEREALEREALESEALESEDNNVKKGGSKRKRRYQTKKRNKKRITRKYKR